MQDGIPIGRKDATNGVHLNQAHLFTTKHVCRQGNETKSCTYTEKAITGRGQRHEQGKALRPTIIYYLQALKQFYLLGLGATSFTQKQGKRSPSKSRAPDRVRRPLWRGAWMTERAPRDRCRLPAPSWCDDGQVATSVPHGS